MKKTLLVCMIVLSGFILGLREQAKCKFIFASNLTSPSRKVYLEGTEWCRVWVPKANRDDKPRVLLVGDSITMGYYNSVEKRLSGKAYVARLATSRSVCDPFFITELKPVVEGYNWSVIHFNNGIHGGDYTQEEYRAGLENTLKYLKEKGGNAKIVGVLSTPPRPGPNLNGLDKRISKRNDIFLDLCSRMKLPVDDLHSLMSGHPEYYRDIFHFKAKPIDMQAGQVARIIQGLLPKKP